MTRDPTVAIMQPYFAPYGGYFRLLARADVFVILDCVQFPRRGFVHRNRFLTAEAQPAWLTLPLRKMDVATPIAKLAFHERSSREWPQRLRRFPVFQRTAPRDETEALRRACLDPRGGVVEFLQSLLVKGAAALGIDRPMLRSSSLPIATELRGQERILAIAEHLGARTYLNAPGGRALYDERVFAARGVQLRFLEPFAGSRLSVVQRLLSEPAAAVARELYA